MPRYVKPNNNFEKATIFTYPHCGALSSHVMWSGCLYPQISLPPRNQSVQNQNDVSEGLFLRDCIACNGQTVFFKSRMVYPGNPVGPPPIDGMPENIRAHYEEARSVAEASPRSAAALLRLAVQKLCKYLDEKGENINQDIANLVKKGLSVDVQRALDIVRVIGNNAVHPGQIDLDDSPQVCEGLFALVNMIVDRMIIQPKKLKELYSSLPESSLQAIQKRDDNP